MTTTSQVPARSDRLPLNAPAASATMMLPASGADGATGLSLTAAPAASVTVKVGVGAVTSTALSTISSPGAAVPETATGPVMVASASGWSSVSCHAPDRWARLHVAHHVHAHHGHR